MIDVAPFVAFAVDAADPKVVGWRGREALASDVEAALSAMIEERTRDAWAEGYRERCLVEGTTADDYRLRLVDLGRDGRYMAGIHFRNLRVDAPFVGVAARTVPFRDPQHVHRVVRDLLAAFDRFRPAEVQVEQRSDPPELALGDLREASADKRLIAGRIGDLLALPRPGRAERVVVEPITAAQPIWSRYERLYDAFHAREPEMRDRVPISGFEKLEESAEAGCLFVVRIDDERAGMIAGLPSHAHGLRGIVVIDEILGERYRGRGFAPACQRRFIEALPASADDVVFGTIDARNTPSLRTALSVGRLDVGGWWFVRAARGDR